MKKVNFTNYLRALPFLLFFLIVGLSKASAQQVNTLTTAASIYEIPQGVFVTSEEALELAETQLGTISTQMKGVPVGTSMYRALELQHLYFTAINDTLGAGTGVPESIVEGLYAITTDYNPATETQILELKQSAIDLFSI